MTYGILAAGAYIPRLRLSRRAIVDANGWLNPALKSQAKGERAMCNWDEDSVTMAVEGATILTAILYFSSSAAAPCVKRFTAAFIAP